MKASRRSAVAVALSLALVSYTASAVAGSSLAGTSCKKVGVKKTQGGSQFVCAKAGQKLVWKKRKVSSPAIAAQIDMNNSDFTTFCDPDPFVPDEWRAFQEASLRVPNACPPPYRYLQKELPGEIPKTPITKPSELPDISSCVFTRERQFEFLKSNNALLKPDLRVMVIPFATLDYPANSDPLADWTFYISWIKSSLEHMTDVPSHYVFDIYPSYFSLPIQLKDFPLGQQEREIDEQRERPFKNQLTAQIVEVADPFIDFSKYDTVFFVSPKSVPRNVLTLVGAAAIKTNEKTFITNSVITSYIDDFKSSDWSPREPFGFLHEMMHIFRTADDYNGNSNGNGPPPGIAMDWGVGNWGNMSGAMSDHLAWDKWAAGMIADSQVRCASPVTSSTHWLKPTTIHGQYEKLLLVRLNADLAIGVESIRSSGFNYKIPRILNGAIVYLVKKVSNPSSYYGIDLKVYCSTNRPCTQAQDRRYRFRLAGAALKAGDYVLLEGMKISVVESGDYGDVVKVEPAN